MMQETIDRTDLSSLRAGNASRAIASALRGAQRLSSRVAVYVPSTQDVSTSCDTSAYTGAFLALLSEAFGGATAQAGEGAWVSPVAGLVREAVTVVSSYCQEEDLSQHIGRIVGACRDMARGLSQDAVAIEVSGSMYLITQEAARADA